jgi:hypothetical protein
MLKAIEYRSFYSKEERDNYQSFPHSVWFDPSKVCIVEEYTGVNNWQSAHNITTIYFSDNRSIKVHGSPEHWVELIDSATR